MKQVLSPKQKHSLRNVGPLPTHPNATGVEDDTDHQTINEDYTGPQLTDYDIDASHCIDLVVGARAVTNHTTAENMGDVHEQRVDSQSKTLPQTVHMKIDKQTTDKNKAPKKDILPRLLKRQTASISQHEPTNNISQI